MSTTEKVNLLDYDRQTLRAYFDALGEKPYRADQIFKWVHQAGVSQISAMTNISKLLREKLSSLAFVDHLAVARAQRSRDGTRKWLFRLADNNCIETVFIPEAGRGTLCVSSQVGCALNCRFCSTGHMGFNRNLSTGEIIDQLWMARHCLREEYGDKAPAITNIVLMGMGEPLLNFDAVLKATNIMMDDLAYGLSKYRVTLSTSGVVPMMQQLAKESELALAVSLHAPTDELRDELVPINKKYPLKQLLATCRNYFSHDSRRKITFEYVMLRGVNDSLQQARQLVRLLADVPAKVNLIPFNGFALARYTCSATETIDAFRHVLQQAGLVTVTRKTRGEDIDAACGQLVGDFSDRTSRSARMSEAFAAEVGEAGAAGLA